MRLFWRTIVAGAAFIGLSSSTRLAAQASDQWIGTWKLNSAQSKFSPAPGPKSLTVTIAKAGAGFKVSAKGIGGDDKPFGTEYSATADGKDAPVTGSADYDVVSIKMLDPMTRHMVRKKGGKEVQTVHSVLSKDGKHFTSTTKGVNAKGQQVGSTGGSSRSLGRPDASLLRISSRRTR
jgi:hypothetical protein